MYKKSQHVVPTAATFGGAILGLLSVAADLIGVIGSILLAVTVSFTSVCTIIPVVLQMLQ